MIAFTQLRGPGYDAPIATGTSAWKDPRQRIGPLIFPQSPSKWPTSAAPTPPPASTSTPPTETGAQVEVVAEPPPVFAPLPPARSWVPWAIGGGVIAAAGVVLMAVLSNR